MIDPLSPIPVDEAKQKIDARSDSSVGPSIAVEQAKRLINEFLGRAHQFDDEAGESYCDWCNLRTPDHKPDCRRVKFERDIDALIAAVQAEGAHEIARLKAQLADALPVATLPPCVNGTCLYSCADDECKKAVEKGIPWPSSPIEETPEKTDSAELAAAVNDTGSSPTETASDELGRNTEQAVCALCGKPMPEGEEMFNYHGYSGPCPQ